MVKYIKIGGEARPVCYNNLALEEFQELTGVSVLDLTTKELVGRAKNMTSLVFAGLKHGWLEVHNYIGDCPITYQLTGRWLDAQSAGEVMNAFNSSMPTGDGSETSAEVGEGKKSPGVKSDA